MQAARRTRHYPVLSPVGSNTPASCQRPLVANASRRLLVIQNTGDNPGLVRFGEPVQGDGTDMLFAAGSGLVFDRETTCPETAVNFGSELGTSWAVVEQVQA